MKYKAPQPEDYCSDEEYLQALDAYEAELLLREDRMMEKYYESKDR